MATEKLASEFPATTHDEWKAAAEKLLKGAPFDKIMLTQTPETITLQPIYEKELLEKLPEAGTLPGQDGFLRGTSASGYRLQPWKIAQEIPYSDPAAFNKALLHDLNAGQNAVSINITGANALQFSSAADVQTAFKEISPEAIGFYFNSGDQAAAVAPLFLNWASAQQADLTKIEGAFNFDPLGELAATGQLVSPLSALYDAAAELVKTVSSALPRFATLGVSGSPYQNSGASVTEELGIQLATGLEYLRALGQRGIEIDAAAKQIAFTFSLGGNFFMEVAKLRAARVLWARIVAELGGNSSAQAMRQHARTGLFNKTRHDPYVNMLRTTTEALSAVIGGVESLTVGGFDECIRVPEEFSRRIARNTQIILQEECELTAVIDPAGGSWYIEKLTDDVARGAWKFFTEIEAKGGASAALKAGFIQEKIAATRKGREKLLNQRRVSLVGTNQYPNIIEKSLEPSHIQNPAPQPKAAAAETIPPLPLARLAVNYEQLRAASAAYKAQHGHGPKIHLANVNALRRHKARADFTRAFFETGGFEVTGAEGSTDVAKITADAVASGAELVVICGHDEDYMQYVPEICKAIKAAKPSLTLILAGMPGEHEAAYKAAGLDTNISVKSDNYATNREFLTKVGVL